MFGFEVMGKGNFQCLFGAGFNDENDRNAFSFCGGQCM